MYMYNDKYIKLISATLLLYIVQSDPAQVQAAKCRESYSQVFKILIREVPDENESRRKRGIYVSLTPIHWLQIKSPIACAGLCSYVFNSISYP